MFFSFSPVASWLLSTISSIETSSGDFSLFSVESCNCRRYRWLWCSLTLEAWPANLEKFHFWNSQWVQQVCAVMSKTTRWTGLRSRTSRGTSHPWILCRAGRPCTWWQKKKSEKHREFSLQVAHSTPGIRWMPAPTILYRDQNKRKHVMVAVWYDLFNIIVLFRYMLNYTRQAMWERFRDSEMLGL